MILNLSIFKPKKNKKISAQIKSELNKAGITQADVARSCGVSSAMVSMVISGKARSKKIEEYIEKATGKKYFK